MAQANTVAQANEIETMNRQTDRYQCNIDTSKAEICKIDPLPILYALQSTLQNRTIDICLCERNPICKCFHKTTKQQTECSCDSDAFVDIHSVKMDLASNCTFICEFMTKRDKLSFLQHGQTKNRPARRQSTIRIFTLCRIDNTERVVMDIVRSPDDYHLQLYSELGNGSKKRPIKQYRFDIVDDIFVQEHVLVVKLNYMSMRND